MMFSYKHFLYSLLICVFCIVAVCSMEAAALDTENMEFRDNDLGTGTLRMIVSLLIVLSLIAVGIFVLKKFTPYKGFISNRERPITVLSKVPLGQRKSICLVKIGNEVLIVGLTNTNISLLSKIDADEYYEEQRIPPHETSAEYTQSFHKILEKIGIKGGSGSTAHEA